ncbi:MAG: FAD:protein FMN transferase [Acidobacteriota bacterium]
MATESGGGSAGIGEPRRISARAFDGPIAIEIRNLPAAEAEAAMRRAVIEILEVEALAEGSTVSDEPLDLRLRRLLNRSLRFCRWSEGATGPLGGQLAKLWGLRGTAAGRPTPDRLEEAVRSARCDALTIDEESSTARLAEGSLLDLADFAPGFAVDRAVEVLRQKGVTNGLVRVGPVTRGVGPGPGGRGWPVELPQLEGLEESLGTAWLKDQALALASIRGNALRVGGDSLAPYLDQRSGRPATGRVATLTVTELGLDAQALSTALFVLGSREGEFRVSALKPTPAVLWLLGSGTGAPLLSSYRWSQVKVTNP